MKPVLMLGLVLTLCWATRSFAAPDDKPTHVADETRRAWEKQGFVTGWARFRAGGFLEFIGESEGKAGDLPVFLTPSPSPGMFVKLPPPDRDFGVLVYPGPGPGFKLGAEDLKALAGMERLTLLTLNNTRVPDGALKGIAATKGLRQLYLLQADLDDKAVADLAGLTELRALSLNDNTRVTDAGLKTVGQLKQLRWLSLGHTQVTNVKDLAGIENLENLFLPGTKITDEGLNGLDGLKKLEGLFLSGTGLTDAGLKHVAGVKGLKLLRLAKTKITDAGVEKLKETLPDLKIER